MACNIRKEAGMIKKAEKKDLAAVVEMAAMLWGSHSAEAMEREFAGLVSSEEAAVFLKYVQDIPAGFAQCQLRHDYVEGTDSSPVGYLEGIYVREEYRKQGCAKELLTVCEQWAGEQGCTEFASDCELGNTDSFHFHMSTGFKEANRIICFTKKLE